MDSLKFTKVYFYGETKEDAFNSCRIFLDLLGYEEFKTIKSFCYLDLKDPNPPLPCYTFRCYCEYVRFQKSNVIKIK